MDCLAHFDKDFDLDYSLISVFLFKIFFNSIATIQKCILNALRDLLQKSHLSF